MNALAAIHVAKKQLGLDEETYRAVLMRSTGKDSAGDMDEGQRRKALAEFERLGFKPSTTGARKRLEGRFAKKLQALWIDGWNLGIIQNREDSALLSFVKGRTGIDHTRFLHHPADAKKAIEALKAWLARDGGVKWGTSSGREWLQSDAAKVAWAQFCRLLPGATLMAHERMFYDEVFRIVPGYAGRPLGTLTSKEWQAVMNVLGERIRQGKC